MSTVPKICIGMPAYNSEATIGVAIESLLGQSFGDFELIVSDNASTDSTRDIVESFAQHDRRICYVRQSENIGANRNYTAVARAARGEYFKWAASSDWCAPTFLEKCLMSLEQNSDAVLAAPRTRLFAGELATAIDYEYDIEVLDFTPAARFITLRNNLALNNSVNGLIRRESLRRTRLLDPFYGADIVLLGQLAMLGKIVRLDEFLYYRRMEVATATSLQDFESMRKHHYPQMSAKVLFQTWKLYCGWIRACTRTRMSMAERTQVLSCLVRMCYWDRRSLEHDIWDAFQYAKQRVLNN
jgi:glycosyltransferase involved in cell wall biosynthesis